MGWKLHEEVEHQRLKWAHDFQIQSAVDLDFVIGQGVALPIGMERKSPSELRRRVAAAAISYRLGIKSVDYTLKKYVDDDLYDEEEVSLGDLISDYIADSTIIASAELRSCGGCMALKI